MADPLSTASGVVALVTFALQSSVSLYQTIRSFRSQDKDARALKQELGDLNSVLETLLETINSHPTLDFKALTLPLQRCGKACEEYGQLIARCTRHSTTSRPSFRNWLTQQYLQGDINDFRTMLSGYKSTINIALANANIRIAAITPKVLEDYRDMILDTTNDLQQHLESLDTKVRALQAVPAEDDQAERQALLEEKESTQQGLQMCAQLSVQIEEIVSTSKESPQFATRPSAHKHLKSDLGTANGTIQSLLLRLQTHEANINQQLEAMDSKTPGNVAAQVSSLQEAKASIHQCIQVVSEAGEAAQDERRNVFEDVTMADDSYAFSVSTVADLVTARRIKLSGRSRHVGGQMSDESYQKTIDAITKLDMAFVESTQRLDLDQDIPPATATPNPRDNVANFQDRFGKGVALSSSAGGQDTPKKL